MSDELGHDRRYAMDATKIRTEFGWQPKRDFASGIRETVQWYLSHQSWVNAVMNENHDNWLVVNYGKRTTVQ